MGVVSSRMTPPPFKRLTEKMDEDVNDLNIDMLNSSLHHYHYHYHYHHHNSF